jgi:hypothetical protein
MVAQKLALIRAALRSSARGACLRLPCPAPHPDLVIVDEAVIDNAGETVGFDPSPIVADDLWAAASGATVIACARGRADGAASRPGSRILQGEATMVLTIRHGSHAALHINRRLHLQPA